ncbi:MULTISPECIES: MATE family efflux transporter [Fusobacterium]|uniref:Multidrug-efflux transporter n=1 Tax=Fusobacterium ulcerans 12-1B TaxID=457404 RepID=H1PPU7_9FUSO|nr:MULTISPECIES: MATE family efflux transporter [Fusobacterium]EHO83422.1 MATE efflux family protein [Fusobacterium ulcerans 12-1B]MCB8565612.1 MATE family efflux transporter [Fusobacterium ulcerans]MCB8650136.1 MATE family efflux transporter [Fusobacterium ulcerans]MDH6458862.1 putative MATE family efflux protein [Fusobacterium sp. PH5-7]MEE0138025.1 MATE family efflux transporter [Fusobacterium ulcerans]
MQKEKVDLSEFYRSFLTIGIPLMIQQLISSSLNFIDNLMIGRLGTEFIAAVGFANSVYRILDLFLFGLCSGMGVFIAQYFGKKNFEMIRRILGKLVLAGITLSLIFSIITFIGAEKIIGIFTKEPQVLAIGVSYIRRALFSYTFYAISFSVGFCLRAMGLTRIPMISASIGVTANTFFNYCLIYGNFGFPRLEERGAAIATVMARMLELSTILFIVYKKDFNLKGNLQSYLNLPKALMKEIIKISTPVFLTEMLWILGVVSLSVAYSKLGTTQAACVQIADIITAISSVLFMGISNSASVIIGHTIGKGDKNKVIAYSRKILQIAFGMAIVSLMLVQGLTNTIVSLYHLPPETHIMAVRTMRTVGMFVFLKMINWTLLIGLFRAGGDTKVAFCLDIFPLWFYAVPVAFIGAYYKVPVYILVGVADFSEVIKLISSLFRYKTLKWIKDVTV